MTKITTGNELFESMLGEINYDRNSEAGKLFPFKVRVGCVKRRPPRHEFFDYMIDMGRYDIEKVLSNSPIKKNVLTFVFPERWLGVAEQQSFMSKLEKHPDNFKQVDIITSSPLLISNFMAEHIRILSWADDDKFL